LDPFLHDCEGEETMNNSEKMVVAARTNTGTRLQEIVDQSTIDGLPASNVTAMKVTIEEAQHLVHRRDTCDLTLACTAQTGSGMAPGSSGNRASS
jgi:hypothetical protein